MDMIVWENARQAALWSYELTGQISDGHWENSRLHNHWERPCYAKVIVSDTIKAGPNWQHNRGYNFAAKELFDVVGDRMIAYVKFTLAFGNKWDNIIDSVVGIGGAQSSDDLMKNAKAVLENLVSRPSYNEAVDGWRAEQILMLEEAIAAGFDQFDYVEYTKTDCRRDLRRMTEIWRESRK